MRVIRGIFVCLAVFSICFSFISGQATKNINPGFDFSGIERFWEIVDVLEQDQEPAAAQWDALFETPGYAEILRHEFSRNYFQDTITAVFMPSKESLAEEIIQKHKEAGGFYSWYTPGVIKGYRQAKKDRRWIEARIQELDKHTPFLLLMTVDVARNPFKFFYLYNEAAKTNGKVPVFSKKAISYIKKLEAKYTKSEQDI